MVKRADQYEPEPDGDPQEPGVDKDIGARVSAVFTAAEKAAQHILTLAHEEAADIHKRAEAEAESLRMQRRYDAEQEARNILDQARADAETIRDEARGIAREVEADAAARKLRLREEVRLLEERIDWAREGMREVATRLDGLFPEHGLEAERENEANDEAPAA
jgi:cell division septum initiation protein DivIVA